MDRVETGAPDLSLKIPCSDEGEFFARLADHVAQRGLRIPTETQRPVGTPVTVALELRNGETLTGEGVIDAHLRLEGRPGVNVRILRFAPGARPIRRDGRAASRAAPPARAGPHGAAPDGAPPLPPGDEPLGEVLFGDLADVAPEAPPASFGSSTVSGEIVAAVSRRTARAERAAIAVVVAVLVVGAAGLAAARWLPTGGPEAAADAHVKASDRLLAEGRLTGEGGALEHLLAAKRLRPEDAAAEERLSHVADLLEALAARALERGDVAVAAIHLTWAERAAPDRASIRATLDALVKGVKSASASEPPATPKRRTAGVRQRRTAPR